jgi:hypothetical protein
MNFRVIIFLKFSVITRSQPGFKFGTFKMLVKTLCLPPHFRAYFLRLGSFFDPEDESDMFLRNVGWLPTGHTALYPNKTEVSITIAVRISHPAQVDRPHPAIADGSTVWFGSNENDLCGRVWLHNWLRNRGNARSDKHVTPTKKLMFCRLRTYSRDRLKSH